MIQVGRSRRILRIHAPRIVLEASRVGSPWREHQHGHEGVAGAALHQLALHHFARIDGRCRRHDWPLVGGGSSDLLHLGFYAQTLGIFETNKIQMVRAIRFRLAATIEGR